MKYGLDTKAASMYGKAFRKAFDKDCAYRVLWKVSGWKANNRVVRWLGKQKASVVIIDLVWKDNHQFGAKERRIAIKRAKKVGRLIKKYPNTKWYVCPYLEPRGVNIKEYEQVIARCKKHLPENTIMVSNAMEGIRVRGAIRAGHHTWYKKGMEIFSFDGIECKDADINKWKEKAKQGGAKMFLLWSWSMNGKYSKKDKRKRRQRTSYPEIKELKSIQALFENGKNASIPDTWIYKPFAEQYAPPIPRGNKPVWIAPIREKEILLKWQEQTIFRFAYEKKYPHGDGYIYRSLTWPIDILQEVKKYNSKGIAEVWVGNKRIGEIHVCQRAGRYLH